MNSSVEKTYADTILNTYARNPVCIVRGSGSFLYGDDGREYLDFFPGFGVGLLGHCHPEITRAIRAQADILVHLPNTFYHPYQAELASKLSRLNGGGKCFFCNSGAEANEAAIKFARRYGAADGRFEIVTLNNSFHGRTYGSMTATAQSKFHAGFEPLLPGFRYADFNDLESVARQVTDKTVAVMLEVIQGEGGVNVATEAFVQGLAELCRKHRMLMIIDEVQTGCGRTGRFFAYEWYGIRPDVVTLSKPIGGGLPMGVMIARRELADVFAPGMHASTFGGSPIVCAAASQFITVIERDRLLEHALQMAEYLETKLRNLARRRPEWIKTVEGKGLMWGVKLHHPGRAVMLRCLEKGLIINCTAERVLRLLPAITVSTDLIDRMASTLEAVLAEQPGE